MVRQSLPLVGHIVREMLGRVPSHVSRDDLMSAGMLALVQAARGFDAERGVAFSGYAGTRIRGAIVDELRRLDWASRAVRRREREVESARNTLAVHLGRTATDSEVAGALGLGVDELRSHRDDLHRASVTSLDVHDDASVSDGLPSGGPTPEDVIEQRERIAYLQDAVAELPERLRVVVQGYFYDDLPMADIAEQLGVTESRVSQMRAEAVALMRGAMTAALAPQRLERSEHPAGCAARRKEAYYASVASHRTYASRLSAPAAGSPAPRLAI